MSVDSFKFLPRLIAAFYQSTEFPDFGPIPWSPLPHPLKECKFGLVTSGGLYHKEIDPPFDLNREKVEPGWGDPTYRVIPVNIRQQDVGVSHLHVNTRDIQEDINILLPIHRFQKLAADGRIGGLSSFAVSFMGYQGFPPNPDSWRTMYGPEVAKKFKAERVDCVLLTPS
jgi:D-proline reductase (dithiol) PrdB